MRVLFYGSTAGNCGPDNVNKGMIKNLTNRFLWSMCKNKCFELLDLFVKLLFSRVVVVSGVSRKGKILFQTARWLKKRRVYIRRWRENIHNSRACDCLRHGGFCCLWNYLLDNHIILTQKAWPNGSSLCMYQKASAFKPVISSITGSS